MKWRLYQLNGWCPARSVEDLYDYARGDLEDFLSRFTVEGVPEGRLSKDDIDYLHVLDELEKEELA